MTEVWAAYDNNRQVIEGVVLERATFQPGSFYHLAVNVWVQHEDGDLLFMQRSAEKSHFPLYYEAGAGGSVLLAETSEQAAVRELKEETGLVAQELLPLFSFTEDIHATHFDVFLAIVSGDKEDIVYQARETANHTWVKPADLPAFFQSQLVFSNQKKQMQAYFSAV